MSAGPLLYPDGLRTNWPTKSASNGGSCPTSVRGDAELLAAALDRLIEALGIRLMQEIAR